MLLVAGNLLDTCYNGYFNKLKLEYPWTLKQYKLRYMIPIMLTFF